MSVLIGTKASPYVRRIRIFAANLSLDFKEIDFTNPEDFRSLLEISPIGKVPVFTNKEITLYDSRIIYNYLNESYTQERLSWDQENELTLINEANDTFVTLFSMKKRGHIVDEESLYIKLLRRRTKGILDYFENKVDELNEWSFPNISLFCLLDWIHFRELTALPPKLDEWRKEQSKLDVCKNTDPRN